MTRTRNTADLSTALTVSGGAVATNPATAFTLRNKLINGNFDYWQRATSQTSSGYGSVDRWYGGHSGTTKTASRQTFTVGQTDVPNNPKYWMRHVVSSVAGSSNLCYTYQKHEDVTLSYQEKPLLYPFGLKPMQVKISLQSLLNPLVQVVAHQRQYLELGLLHLH